MINSIKTFMKHRDWPVVVVLSGIPELLEKVNLDPQLRNVLTPYYLHPLDPLAKEGFDEIDTVLYGFSEATGIGIDAVRNEDVFMRMCHGHGNMYGRVFRFLVDVFASLPVDLSELTVGFLADRYALKTGCIPGQNVFLRDDYLGCDVEALMAGSDRARVALPHYIRAKAMASFSYVTGSHLLERSNVLQSRHRT